MIPLTALAILRRVGPYLAVVAACLAAYLWIHGMQATIAKDRASIATLQAGLAAEQQARKADVAGLTTLAQGLVAASSAKAKDQQALTETIDVAHPAPASPALAGFLRCLAAADSGKECTTTGTGTATSAAAAGPGRR